jgi:ketosteroid isomerase-like protein
MPDLSHVIETMENRWMRAWVNRDIKTLKSLTARDFIFLAGSSPPAILDRPSWLDAVAKRYRCTSYRFETIYVRNWGSTALFASPLELSATMDGEDWSKKVWVIDLWRKGRVRRGWKLVQRVMSRIDEDPQLRAAIKSLQLWKQ